MKLSLPACSLIFLFIINSAFSQAKPAYPYPVSTITLKIESKQVKMAYMDVMPQSPSGKTALLFHGKNFNGYYWKYVIGFLVKKGYRVIVPDQVGWGMSDRPDIHYSFHLLAYNTKQLLDSLHINKVLLIGHSMGGMLAGRFTMMYPETVEKLILEDPIGLEDYKRFIPYQTLEKQFEKESKATYSSYLGYQKSYFPVWKPEYEQYVQAQATDLDRSDFQMVAWANALTYQMIYEQPVCYEWDRIRQSVLLIVGELDRTVVGKELLPETRKNDYGNYPQLGKKTRDAMPHCKLIETPGMGHITHIQDPALFEKIVLDFID